MSGDVERLAVRAAILALLDSLPTATVQIHTPSGVIQTFQLPRASNQPE